jgi:hypothetical protein
MPAQPPQPPILAFLGEPCRAMLMLRLAGVGFAPLAANQELQWVR